MKKSVYETVLVFDGVLSDDVLRKEIETVSSFLGGAGSVQKVDEWGRRDLAYTIRKRKSGYYVLFMHECEGDVPGKLGRMLRLNEKVLRYLTVVSDPNVAIMQAQHRVEMAARAAAMDAAGGRREDADDDSRDE